MKNIYLITFFLLSPFFGKSQSISGIINIYTKVVSITNCTCPTTNCATITVSSTAGLSTGDRFLIIQMKGASIDGSNTETHGSITALNDAGNYEFGNIASISGSTITTVYPLQETYFTGVTPTDSACVQLIRVPVYTTDVTVSGTLTAQAWDGTTGGVLAFETSGNVTLNATIDVSGMGFRKAKRQSFSLSCGDDTAYYYQSTSWNYPSCSSCGYEYDDSPLRTAGEAGYGGCGSPCITNRMSSQDPKLGGWKGEGISALLFTKTFANGNIAKFEKGKGKLANGGGGGGNHNGGGGGGGNYGAGGFGGNAFYSTACPAGTHAARRGRGGTNLDPTGSKIFMGGGGGEGHDNGGNGNTGTNGGGIIILKASSIINNGYAITANGIENTAVSSGDASGGGGAGGTILLETGVFTNALSISAKGGKGGDHSNPNCHGTGGGGGGGVIWLSGSCTPVGVSTNIAGGINGKQVAASPDCGDADWGSSPGGAGIVKCGLASGASFFLNQNSCSLPVAFHNFVGKYKNHHVKLIWNTTFESNAYNFEVERSLDGISYFQIGEVKATGNTNHTTTYSFIDYTPPLNTPYAYYRLKQNDINGSFTYSNIIVIYLTDENSNVITVSPIPVKQGGKLSIRSQENEDLTFELFDLAGREIKVEILTSSENNFETELYGVASGTYIAILTSKNIRKAVRIIIE